MKYTPHNDEDIRKALEEVGVDTVDELFSQVPAELLDPPIDIPDGLDETSLLERMKELAAANSPASTLQAGGVAKHFIPTVTEHLAMQSEFVTAYTPYQPEVSQGILQATFEYQTMMSELTGLPISNASMYDGTSAAAEAALLAVRHTDRERVAVSTGVHPETREVIATYLSPLDIEVVPVELTDDLVTADPSGLDACAALIVQQPNFLGYLEGMDALGRAAHAAGALFISVVEPLSLAVLKSPGEYGADVAVGDGQTLGNPLSFGGPHFGFMVVSEPLLRQLPGRIVGETVDVDGRRAFVLTLQAREQHIRRARAKSNICSNHQLTALMAAVNLAALGPQGLREVAVGSVAAAHDLATELIDRGYRVRNRARFFNEFAVQLQMPARELQSQLAMHGVLAGVPVPASYGLGDAIVLGATELTTRQERDRFLAAMQRAMPVGTMAGGRA